MKTVIPFLRRGAVAMLLIGLVGVVSAKNVPGDAAIPVVELMPLTMKHEADLGLSDAQIKALVDFRKQAMPNRVAVQKKIVELRGQLRMAILENKPQADREVLAKRIGEAEVEHMQGRSRCTDFLRQTLSTEQFSQLSKLYLDGLR